MQYQLNSSQLSIIINSFGAELCSVKNKDGLEFIWQANKNIWPRHAPVLFPIVGKLKDDSYIYNGIKYNLSQHGFARDLDFELVEAEKNHCIFQLKSTTHTKKTFPFDFIFKINYQLIQNQLIIDYNVINTSSTSPLFFSVGAHPAFKFPLLPTENAEDYFLEFEKKDFFITQLNSGLCSDTKIKLQLNNHKLFLTPNLFDNDALVFENHQINTIRLVSLTSPHTITLQCKNWPYFGIWSKKGAQEFICLEPWQGIADKITSKNMLDEKVGIIKLAANDEFNCTYSITFT